MTALLSEQELERKADNATALFTFDPSDMFYWRDIFYYAKDEGLGMATDAGGREGRCADWSL